MKMVSRITTLADVEAMVSALENLPNVGIVRSDEGVVVSHLKAKKEVFRAMVGTSGNYLVRYPEQLFL